MRRALTIVVASLAVASVACSSSSSTDGAPTTTTRSRPSSSTTTSTTAIERTVPTTAADAARRIELVESIIHDPAVADDDPRLAAAGHAEQLIIRAYADHPDWLPSVPERWRATVADGVEAQTALRSLVATEPKTTLPAWTIRPPKPIAELRRYYDEAAAQSGVPWHYLAAVHFVETKMGRIEGNSSAGAQGPMQFLPSTWAAYGMGGDIRDDRDAILGAANYLKASGAPQDMAKALFAYNRSERYVRAITVYAERMKADPLAYRAYWGWQVYYATGRGAVWLREGYSEPAERPVTDADL
jgi:membrane-bound lytic murein transglycosylase B